MNLNGFDKGIYFFTVMENNQSLTEAVSLKNNY